MVYTVFNDNTLVNDAKYMRSILYGNLLFLIYVAFMQTDKDQAGVY